jgi:putative membrane protein
VALGVAPAVLLWYKGSSTPATVNIEAATQEVAVANVKVAFK